VEIAGRPDDRHIPGGLRDSGCGKAGEKHGQAGPEHVLHDAVTPLLCFCAQSLGAACALKSMFAFSVYRAYSENNKDCGAFFTVILVGLLFMH
jgi:hypothetical protein